jgi:hypothetical protein
MFPLPPYAFGNPAAMGGVVYSSEVTQFLKRLAPQPTGSLLTDYVNLIDGLVADGLWTKLDLLQVYATGYVGQAVVNLISDSWLGNPEVLSGNLAFTANRGYLSPDNSTRFCASFDPSVGGDFTQNSGFIGVWSLTSTQISQAASQLGPINSATQNDKLAIYPKWSNGQAYGYITNGVVNGALASNSDGFFVVQRSAASGAGSVQLYKNTTSIVTGNPTNAAYTAGEVMKLRCRHETALSVAGQSLSAGEHTSLYNRLATFLTARGAI